MPNRRRSIDASTPLGGFALKLLDLKRKALAQAGSSSRARAISIDKIAAPDGLWKTSRASIYAALNGTRLPSTDTLCAMVTAWDEDSAEARGRWLRLRSDVEDALMGTEPASSPGNVDAAMEKPLPGPQDQLGEAEFTGSSKVVPDVASHIELKQMLRDALERSGLTKSQVAARTELGRTTVSQAFNTEGSSPSANTLYALSRALRLDKTEQARLLALRELAVTGRGPRNIGHV
ncbi:helix-turn-helix transcriptional regulator [Streptomyces brevispora]|uniref:Helix-turn-helix protein n=1 Tax=Streptomyces brevispora TaxID=887462 RepID=A0A561TYZ9_9ACTN|nr:helix-turn-helix transcriptional regulator [Streptomyces brevispora]TWF92327.1 helix-turn-helix protein [Streptomyces brevispora]